ncbi:MAG: choice-of-anchor D domain-containing protein [Bryobacterales bacterium]|nr:choice-of-anchor D domain-containing protein [Bryobacterales bacterium]
MTRSSGEIATLTNPEKLSLSARVNATSRLLAALSGGRAATFTAEAYTLGTETAARTLPGCPASTVRDTRQVSQASELTMTAAAQCGEFRTLRLGTYRKTEGTQLVEFDAYVVSAAQMLMSDLDLSGPVATLRNLSYSVRFRSVWRFTLTAPVVPDSITISSANPAGGKRIEPESQAGFEAQVRYEIRRPEASIALRATGTGGRVLATSSAQRVTQGTGTASLKIDGFTLPAGETVLAIRAVVLDGQNVVAQSAAVDYVLAFDFKLSRIEVFQVVQTEKNEVPLVAEKATMARVYVELVGGVRDRVPGVEVVLEASRSDKPPRTPVFRHNAGEARRVGVRFPKPAGFDFVLPKDWTLEGTTRLRARVNPSGTGAMPEVDRSDNELPYNAEFEMGPSLVVRYVPVCVQLTDEEPPVCPSSNISTLHELARAVYPVAEGEFRYLPVPGEQILYRRQLFPQPDTLFGKFWFTDIFNSINQTRLMMYLRKYYEMLLSGEATEGLRLHAFDQLVAWLPSGSAPGFFAMSDPRRFGGTGRVVWVVDESTRDDETLPNPRLNTESALAHEMGHNFGLRHPNTTDSCKAWDDETDWPNSSSSVVQELGYAAATAEPRRPGLFQDLMSYCYSNLWISQFHYEKLMRSHMVPQMKSLRSAMGERLAEAARYAIVAGTVGADDSAQFDPFYVLPGNSPARLSEEGGAYCVVQRNGERELSRHCFDLGFRNPGSLERTTLDSFAFRLPYEETATKMQLVKGERELAVREASANRPQLRILSPAAGARWSAEEQSVTWEAEDADGDSLLYAVAYSSDDGKSWLPLDVDNPATEYKLKTSRVRGGNAVRFRVLATDGFHTTAVDAGPVQITQTARMEAAPGNLDFLNVLTGATAERTVTIRNTGNGPLEVTELTLPAAYSVQPQAPLLVAAGGQMQLRVRFAPDAAQSAAGAMRMRSNDGSRPVFEIPLAGAGVLRDVPEMVLSATSLDFGAVASGQTKDLTLGVLNRGPAALDYSMRNGNAAFTISGAPAAGVLPAGGSAAITVRYRSAGTAASDTITILSNDPARPSATVRLQASAVAVTPPPPTQAVLRNDNGNFDVVVGYPEGPGPVYLVTRLTPPRYPATLRSVQLIFHGRSDGLKLNDALTVLSGGHASGQQNINGVALQRTPGTVQRLGDFQTYTVPPVTIASGDFVVGFLVQAGRGLLPGEVDTSSTAVGRSYGSVNGTAFLTFEEQGGKGSLGARAVVELP